mgnify:CR=1 FL=1
MIGEKLSKLRKENGISQEELAEMEALLSEFK